MSQPEINKIYFTARPNREGEKFTGVRLFIGEDFYIDVACRDGSDSKAAADKAGMIANELEAALLQVVSIQEGQK